MPPLGIFNSEWMIFSGGFDSGYPIALTVATLLGSLFTVIYALRFFGKIFFGEFTLEGHPITPPKALVFSTLAVTVFLIIEGLLPAPLISWAIKGLGTVLGGGS
jgi:NADH:ubiquinone oxidoreductase subunit 5 (subunit L)/multisubunit Na+/H+ antiporter MnhA subunit